MSNKYIGQINNQNFIYPNNDLPEYDIDIIHNINDYSVSGTVTNFVVSGVTTTSMTINFDLTWSLNNAQRFLRNNGNTSIYSVHMLAAGQDYFKPWRLVNSQSQTDSTITTYSGHTNFGISPFLLGLTSFTNGTYYFEFRLIGSNAIYPICQSYTVSTLPTPTPTPTLTPTPTPISPTATPTPTPTVTGFTSGATLNVTDTGYIKYVKKGDSSATYVFISTLGTYTITDCLTCSTILPGFPFADVANFTVTSCGSVC